MGSPVIKELQAVKNKPPKFIAVDDLNCFKDISSYPTVEEIEKQVAKIGKYTSSTYYLDQFVSGILVFEKADELGIRKQIFNQTKIAREAFANFKKVAKIR